MNEKAQEKLHAIVKKNYTEIVDDFNETRKRHLGPLWSEVIKFAGKAKEGSSILDLGCGNGRLLQAFEDNKIIYTGIDFIPEIIEYAKKNFGNISSSVEFLTGDILELEKIGEIQEKKYDYIFCLAVLHHLPGSEVRERFLNEAKKYLKEDGKILLTAWNIWGQKKFWPRLFTSSLKKVFGLYEYDFGDIFFHWKGQGLMSLRYYHAFTAGELKRTAEKSGLKVESVFKDEFNYYLIAGK
ncbi:MAG: class I SAM-dependent methyltransferase [Patescibacteria group bacterium]|jgi:2-polyprenyl-3-methyl-5-hydroxy-6-metoxy-1,4-benzoquinol methylase